jgi:hypothetical protein
VGNGCTESWGIGYNTKRDYLQKQNARRIIAVKKETQLYQGWLKKDNLDRAQSS